MKLSRNLEENRKMMAKLFPIEKSFDLIERQIVIGGKKAVMYFIDGFVKDGVVGKIMQFFLGLTPDQLENVNTAQDFAARFVSYVEVSTESDVEKITTQYLSGPAILMIDGYEEAILIDARTYPARSTEEPEKEKVLRGSRDGFVETVVFNTALIRRRIRDPKFVAEVVNVGNRSRTDVVIAYIDDIVDKKTLEKIKKRIESIDVRSLTMSQESLAECLIKRKWYNPFPKIRYTERPDIAAANVLEGNIVILVDNDPSAMVLPSSIFDFIQEADDFYYPPVIGGYMRAVRNLIFFSTLVITPLWLLAIQNMDRLPEWLHFLQIAEPNEVSPVVQLLILEVAIDVLKLASVNTPNMLGNSLSIIGALILGDFAIQSGWFVPDTILYMSIVAICSFSQPSVELNYAFKFMRIIILVLSHFFNLTGFIIGVVLSFVLIGTNKTVTGKGYLYPIIPFNAHDFKYKFLRLKIRSTEKMH
ncbi:spore germination protein [Congzhengia sp.]|uniref:spore germination protein n=1 Tax=Congzhengia sp. TaxID=2944168 RepID=UPI003078A013